MTSKQRLKIKSSIIDANNYLNGIFSSFNYLNSKFFLRSRLADNFSSFFFISLGRLQRCHILSLPVQNIHPCSNTILLTSRKSLSFAVAIFLVTCPYGSDITIQKFYLM